MKYGGAEDSLDFKLIIFYDWCRKINVSEACYADAFSIMLKGEALEYYYHRISGKGLDFAAIVLAVRQRFETEHRRWDITEAWNNTTLLSTIQQNKGKSIAECFEIMLNKLQHLQRGLPSTHQHDDVLTCQLLSACRGVKDCYLAIAKPADTFEELTADIRRSIALTGCLLNQTQDDKWSCSSEESGGSSGINYQFWGNTAWRKSRNRLFGQIMASLNI